MDHITIMVVRIATHYKLQYYASFLEANVWNHLLLSAWMCNWVRAALWLLPRYCPPTNMYATLSLSLSLPLSPSQTHTHADEYSRGVRHFLHKHPQYTARGPLRPLDLGNQLKPITLASHDSVLSFPKNNELILLILHRESDAEVLVQDWINRR